VLEAAVGALQIGVDMIEQRILERDDELLRLGGSVVDAQPQPVGGGREAEVRVVLRRRDPAAAPACSASTVSSPLASSMYSRCPTDG